MALSPGDRISGRLPCTLVGKVAFNTLEREEISRLKAEGKYCGE